MLIYIIIECINLVIQTVAHETASSLSVRNILLAKTELKNILQWNELFDLNFDQDTIQLFRCLIVSKISANLIICSYKRIRHKDSQTFATEKKYGNDTIVNPPIHAVDAEVKHKNIQ